VSVFSTLRFILHHPLNRDRPLTALVNYARWQIGSRLVPGQVVVPFVTPTRLLVTPGMTGATQNIYCGLQEFEEMALLLHTLRPGDLFVDVGANIGSYTILAAGAAGADCIAFEPVRQTFDHLQANVRINDLQSRVRAHNIGIAASRGTLVFTSSLDTVNHVLSSGETCEQQERIPVQSLDDALSGSEPPTFIKIDVEGFETEVIRGARTTLKSRSLLVIVVELNGSGQKYGYDEMQLHESLRDSGFQSVRYDPFARALTSDASPPRFDGNRIYCRDPDRLGERVLSARRFSVRDHLV
jgi:FkbM family methyltransferase